MATIDDLSAPGASTYDSSTMHVGDGTWDNGRNTFLLPNLQGLNFGTMQYNGMGNRFRGLPEYHVLIIGHGVIAAITFLGLVPAAIFIARFYHARGRTAYKLHVYFQILTVFLATVVLILGWFAVGPERSLTNPHHGIGVAIYVCVLVQFLYGWWMSRRERKRTSPHPTIPLKVHIHRLFGRAIALLAFVQIALGLTLYGSPKVLFILYALWGAFLLFWYLTLEYRNKPRLGLGGASGPRSDYYSDYTGSYTSGPQTELTHDGRRREKDESHWGRNILAGAGAIGAYEWWKHRKERRQDERESKYEESMRRQQRLPGTPGHPDSSIVPARTPSRGSQRSRRHDGNVHSPQTWENDEYDDDDEKYDNRPPRKSGNWRDRLLGAGAGIAAFEGVKGLFGGKKHRDDDYTDTQHSYRPSQTDVSRVEAGQAPFSPHESGRNQRPAMPDPMTPTRPPPRRRPSRDSLSYADEESVAPARRHDTGGDQTLRESIGALGAIAGFREWNKRRKDRREQEKMDRIRQDELDSEEQFNRRNSNRYPRPQDASGRRPSLSGTLMTGPSGPDPVLGSNPQLSRQNLRPDTTHPPLPAAAGIIPSASGAPPSTVGPSISQQHVYQQQQYQQQQLPYNIPPPPPGPPPGAGSARPADYQAPVPGSLQMPLGAVNPDPSRLLSQQNAAQQGSSGLYRDSTPVAVAEAAAAAGQRTQSQSPSRRGGSRTRLQRPNRRGSSAAASGSQVNNGGPESTGSPPVSVKVNMHPDGRHVTLRRLNEEEAAAERNGRRRDRRSRRASSLSSGGEDASRYRRDNGIRRSSDQPITNIPPPPAMSNSAVGSHRPPSELTLPPVPPAGRMPQASVSPQGQPSGLLPAAGPAGSGAVGSPGTDVGTGSNVTFENNRRRRRAERARRDAAKNQNRVEFE